MADQQQQQKDDKTTFLHAFKQQIMKAWQPVPTLNSTIVVFSILYVSERYDTKCSQINYQTIKNPKYDPVICPIELEVTEKMEDNFYQNHRRYVKSKNVNQLQGENVSKSDLTDCSPIVTYQELRKYRFIDSRFQDTDVANPCGLIAASMFNDTYKMYDSNNKEVEILDTDIAWPSDKKSKYKKNGDQWQSVVDERFMVWMRTAALPNFRKLWGRIEGGLEKGKYKILIENNYPVDTFDGKKYFVVSTANAFGGKNQFLAISYLVMGGICFFILIVFIYKKISYNKQKNQKDK